MENFFYRVGESETLNSVCEKFNLPQTLVISENNLRRELEAGDLLVLSKLDGGIFYRVKPTDTLASLSKKFGVPERKILQDNDVDYIFYGLNIVIYKNFC